MSETFQQQVPEVVTFGESMALFMPSSNKGIEHAAALEKLFGGAESNLAIGLARLGHRVGWFGRLGDDPLGRFILKKMRGEGVDVSRAALSSAGPTGLMIRETVAGKSSVYYYRKRTAMSEMRPEELDAAYIGSARILHVTGITPALSDSCRQTLLEAVRIARASGVCVCFDPNIRLKLWNADEAKAVLVPIAEQADYFLPGLDELKLLYGTDDLSALTDKLGKLPGVSVIKGGNGVTHLLEDGVISAVPHFPVKQVVDTVGAGDAFCAGFLSGVLRGKPLGEAVRFGNLLGSLAVQVHGDWEGLPTLAEAESMLGGKEHVER
ncbi:sugar kinase [Paenibacillus beijingensis]|uniref:2-dehydro-3-deoxygluconokinase n=1 Tax=Paenibacillus beijingensis TaxID=1126833 RepID=A0A0D5NR01_9BACL|nr:sugar kinase [Paenibacillus beijingensis]AJY77338.1 2-dehydro-3-deoxygluconokinase [Paenibacillus beijingensis]